MYYGKKKAIVLSIIIILLVIVLAIGGIFLYLTTDLFKSNQTLFFKYIANQYSQLTANSTNAQLQDILNAEKQMPCETNANITFSYEDENGENIEELEKAKINIVTREDKAKQKEYANIKIDYDNINLMDVHYAKSNNIYALKWEEIVLNYFVGIENESLKEFAKKIGATETENIPDQINTIDYLEILELTQQEKQNIMQTYTNVLLESIPKEKYTKQKEMAIVKNGVNYNTTAYRLDLSAEEIKTIELKILETLKQDSITLNLITTKAKLLSLTEEYTTINGLTTKIQETINEVSNKKVDNSKGLSIVVYSNNGQAIQTELILKNEMKITINHSINNNTQLINLIIDNLSEEQEYNTMNIDVEETKNNDTTKTKISVNVDGKQTSTMTISTQTTYGTLTEEIVNLDNTNCVVLNNYSVQDLNNLINAIAQRISYVFEQKVQLIAMDIIQGQMTENTVTE